jgi:hypothetical protein
VVTESARCCKLVEVSNRQRHEIRSSERYYLDHTYGKKTVVDASLSTTEYICGEDTLIAMDVVLATAQFVVSDDATDSIFIEVSFNATSIKGTPNKYARTTS